jgi:hypothetical protein
MLLNVLVMSHVQATKNAIPGCVVPRDEQGEKGFRPPMEIYLALCDILAGYTPSALIGSILHPFQGDNVHDFLCAMIFAVDT